MKRSIAQELPPQEASSKMSRHDLEAIEETETPTTNIFLVETVLRRLFRQIETVSKLKELRKMCQLWDRVDAEELEERAFQERFKPINLTFSDEISGEFKPIKDSSLKMREFLDDTSSNPRLFRSFTIKFPCSLAVLNLYKFRWFYNDYSPTFLELAISEEFRFNQDKERFFKGLLRWAAPTLRELVIRNIYAAESDLIPTRKSLPVQSFNFPHLRKVNMKSYGRNGIVEAFKIIFTNENCPETPSLASLRLPYVYPFDLLDLNSNPSRWATLTMLNILFQANGQVNTNRFTNGLLSLARAGMTLKKLHLGLLLMEDVDFIVTCRNLSEFFASQASSLEALKLTFMIKLVLMNIEEHQLGQIKIKLPVFQRLHSLSLDLDNIVFINILNDISTNDIFEFSSISQHFPALENLNILNSDDTLDAFLRSSNEIEERLNLKRIAIPIGIIWRNEENTLRLDKYFGSVETVDCFFSFVTAFPQGSLDNKLRILGDLVNTIRVLHIRDVTSDLDLSKFKGLRRVVIDEDDKANLNNKKLIEHKNRYLGYFKKIAELGLDSIKFRGLELVGDEYKDFAEAFPFRVEFEEKLVDWRDEDFMDN